MCARKRADLVLTGRIESIHRASRGLYGSPMIHAELADDHQIRVGRKRVARLMRAAGLRGATLRRFIITTQPDLQAQRAIDLSIVLDVFSRRIVGWAMETHLRTELILAALNMAVTRRQPRAVVHHSDRTYAGDN